MSLYIGKVEDLTRELSRYRPGTIVHVIGSGRVVFTDDRNAAAAEPLFDWPTDDTVITRGTRVIRISDGMAGRVLHSQGEGRHRSFWVMWNDYTDTIATIDRIGVPPA